ncbi:hypothetical protein [Flaviaesturariibacter terrae]
MKTAIRLSALLCLPLFFSCGREAQPQNESPAPYLTQGQWKVSSYSGSTVQANSLSGYALRFSADGSLSCGINGSALSGTWSLHQKVEGRSISLQVAGQTTDASALSNDWDVQFCDNNTVKLRQGNTELALGRP